MERGAESLGFDTLAASCLRSYAIHAFPPYTSASFLGHGLSILDFGIKSAGYTSDVTLTYTGKNLTAEQERMIGLVEEAYSETLSMIKPGESTMRIAQRADDIFARQNLTMPHALGHGIGLDAHEAPILKNNSAFDAVLKPGMVFTLEPGLYDPRHGGVRLENDVLVTASGYEVLTKAGIIRY